MANLTSIMTIVLSIYVCMTRVNLYVYTWVDLSICIGYLNLADPNPPVIKYSMLKQKICK